MVVAAVVVVVAVVMLQLEARKPHIRKSWGLSLLWRLGRHRWILCRGRVQL